MGTVVNFILCSIVVVIAQGEVSLEADRPFLRVKLFETAILKCCYKSNVKNVTWAKHKRNESIPILPLSDSVTTNNTEDNGIFCGILTLKSARLNDTGFYWCVLIDGSILDYTHGTYLQVYEPLEKTISLRESTKNKILTAEGILLLLCVIVPSASLIFQSKRLSELEKKKVTKEEENIYQGLNLDDCCTTYDQIERSQAHGPYQDVCNIIEEEEEIQLEKP
ncbi:B-cell antigen receptor complex-associated protein alpha chain [Micropterus salmoides]|uniref:B-cell antigen receptor complex-associated protein alpha chain n=1 Tax=Micropterus salmoides TaxID=27706 RepID=UPI0018ECFD83|nr:B-cell antigen receptor complex-associated protein alpha chain [Micropterus salmoides]